MADRRCAVAVVGAGPYGLSSAAHLLARGLEVTVLGSTMASWREGMPQGMVLKSTPSASSISAPTSDASLADYLALAGQPPLEAGDRVPLEQFVAYGTWFEQRFVADARDESSVVRLNRDASGFALELDTGDRLRAASVVVAAGHRPHAHIPSELEELSSRSDLVSHASHHTDLSLFAGRRVAIVGAGQSALETAALLGEAGAEVVLVARGSALDWDLPPRPSTRLGEFRRPLSGIGPGWPKWFLEHRAELVRYLPESTRTMLLREVLGPSGAYWLRERFEARAIAVHTGTRVRHADASHGGVRLCVESPSRETVIDADHVIAATGYRFDVDRIAFLDSSLRADIDRLNGFPRLSAKFESSVPGLYFTGLAAGATFGPLMRFVCGTRFAGPRLAAGVTRALRGTPVRTVARRSGTPNGRPAAA